MRQRCRLSFVLLLVLCGSASAQTPAPAFVPAWPSPILPSHGQASKDTICVYVVDQVQRPGVYYLPRGSTVRQAVEAAQGLTRIAGWSYFGIVRPYRNVLPQTIRFGRDQAKAERMTLEDGDQLYFGHEVY